MISVRTFKKRPPPRQIIIKMLKVKDNERIIKAAKENQLITYKGTPIKLPVDFSTEILQARRDWHKILKMTKSKNLQRSYSIQQIYHLGKKEVKEFLTTKPALHEILKGIL